MKNAGITFAYTKATEGVGDTDADFAINDTTSFTVPTPAVAADTNSPTVNAWLLCQTIGAASDSARTLQFLDDQGRARVIDRKHQTGLEAHGGGSWNSPASAWRVSLPRLS